MPVIPRVLNVAVGPSGLLGQKWTAPTYIEAEVTLDAGKRANTAEVKLYNLGDASVAWLEQANLALQISAGQPIPQQLFLGDVNPRGVITEVAQPSRVTTVSAGDGRANYRNARYVGSFPPGTSSDLILADILLAVGLPLGYRDPLIIAIPYAGGWAFAGKARDALDQIADDIGFVWSIQGGAVQLCLPNSPVPDTVVLLSAGTGLVGSPKRTDRGVDLTAKLQPTLRPRSIVSVQSLYVTGFYRVEKIKHVVNSWGTRWESRITAEPVEP